MSLSRLVSPIEPQWEFLRQITKYDFVLYEGEGGAGKSYILRWWLVLFLIACYKKLGLRGVRVGIFCETFKTLQDRQVSRMRAEFPPGLGAFKSDPALDFVLRDEYGGGHLCIRNLAKPDEYSSAEFAAIAVDELTKNPLSVFNDLRWRLRWPGLARPKFGAATNPGGKGHAWVKKYWIKKEFPAEMQPIADQFVRVHAKTSDNTKLSPGYSKNLKTLPPEMAGRLAYGNWDIYTGQYFPRFNADPRIVPCHVIPHAQAMARIQAWHARTLSGDWGFDHPHCFHWHAKDERNCVVTYREIWGRGVGEGEVGRQLTAAEAQDFKLAQLRNFVFSWDAGKLSPRASKRQPKSISDMVAAALGPRIPKPHPCDSSPGVRLIRARLMSQVIEAGTWLISDACPKLIAAIPEMIRDEDDPEQMAKMDWNQETTGDDPVDSAGMGLQWMIGSPAKPDEVTLEEKFHQVRQRFAARVEPAKPGEDWFSKFGGRKATKRGR